MTQLVNNSRVLTLRLCFTTRPFSSIRGKCLPTWTNLVRYIRWSSTHVKQPQFIQTTAFQLLEKHQECSYNTATKTRRHSAILFLPACGVSQNLTRTSRPAQHRRSPVDTWHSKTQSLIYTDIKSETEELYYTDKVIAHFRWKDSGKQTA